MHVYQIVSIYIYIYIYIQLIIILLKIYKICIYTKTMRQNIASQNR